MRTDVCILPRRFFLLHCFQRDMLSEEVFRIPAFRDLVLKSKVQNYFTFRSFDPVHEKCDIFDGPVQFFGACHR